MPAVLNVIINILPPCFNSNYGEQCIIILRKMPILLMAPVGALALLAYQKTSNDEPEPRLEARDA
jgi:hypothetical protein